MRGRSCGIHQHAVCSTSGTETGTTDDARLWAQLQIGQVSDLCAVPGIRSTSKATTKRLAAINANAAQHTTRSKRIALLVERTLPKTTAGNRFPNRLAPSDSGDTSIKLRLLYHANPGSIRIHKKFSRRVTAWRRSPIDSRAIDALRDSLLRGNGAQADGHLCRSRGRPQRWYRKFQPQQLNRIYLL